MSAVSKAGSPGIGRRLLENLFNFDEAPTPGERLYLRTFEGLVSLAAICLAWHWALYIRELPGMIAPLGLANYVDLSGLFNPYAPLVLALALSALCVAAFAAPRLRVGYLLAVLLLHLLYVMRFSMGKVGHGSMMIGMSLLGLAVSSLFFADVLERRRFALGFITFFAGFGYVLSACCKLVGTGITWPASWHLELWMAERMIDVMSETGAFHPNLLQGFVHGFPVLATAMLSISLLTESMGWLLWFRRTRPYIALALVMMHVGISLVLDIGFDLFIAELLVIGLPWPVLLNRLVLRPEPSLS